MKRFDIDRLISHAYSLLLALVFLYAYQNLSGMSENGDLYVRAGFTGILYSLAGCVVCVCPILCA